MRPNSRIPLAPAARVVLAVFVAVASPVYRAAAAPATREALRQTFETELAAATARSRTRLSALSTQYTQSLDQLRRRAQADGNLDAMLTVQKEIERFGGRLDVAPGDIMSRDSDLGRLQAGYLAATGKARAEDAQAVVDLAGLYARALDALQAELTRQGRVDDALAARADREGIEQNPAVADARFALAELEAQRASAAPQPEARQTPGGPPAADAAAGNEEAVRRRHRTFYQALSMRSTGSALRFVLPDQRKQPGGVNARLANIVDLVAVLKKAGLSDRLLNPPEIHFKDGGREADLPTPYVELPGAGRTHPPGRWVLVDGEWYVDVM